MKAQLKVVFNDKEFVHELILNKPMTVGRTHRSDLATDDPMMSAVHCRFILKPDRLELFDMESKNGVYLNGIRVERSEIFINDTIKVGNCSINLEPGKMDPNSTNILTFPGPFKERVDHELKIDYSNNPKLRDETGTHALKQNMRKKFLKAAPANKAEVKGQHKGKAALALTIDIAVLLVIATFIPVKILQWMATQPKIKLGSVVLLNSDINQHKVMIFLGLVVLVGLIFTLINFRKKGFSIGETLSGFPSLMKKT